MSKPSDDDSTDGKRRRNIAQRRFPEAIRRKIISLHVAGDGPTIIAEKLAPECPWITPRKVVDLTRRSGTAKERTEIVALVERARTETVAEVVARTREKFANALKQLMDAEIAQLVEDQQMLGQVWKNGMIESASDLLAAMRAKSLRMARQSEFFGLGSAAAQQVPTVSFPFDFKARWLAMKQAEGTVLPPATPIDGEAVPGALTAGANGS